MREGSSMRSRQYAEILLRKAAQDEFVLTVLVPLPESPDEAIGFHAQQAVEKLLKLDRSWAVECVRLTRRWAESVITQEG